MAPYKYYIVIIALAAVAASLFLGILGLLRKNVDARRSNLFMKLRVGLQALAVLLLTLFVYWR